MTPAEELLIWQKEAAFARAVLNDYFASPQSLNVLEIGSGTGLLLQKLHTDFPQHKFIGLEPFGAGFAALEGLQVETTKATAPILSIGYSDFKPEQKFDVIFSVNVFEHLPDWKNFISTARDWLTPGGKIIVLCPNYGFPYESHFGIPIVINKEITAKLFSAYIDSAENERNIIGLWSSLNFVRKSQVEKFCKQTGLGFNDRRDILDVMVARLLSDNTFRQRHRWLFYVATSVRALGLIRFLRTRLFKRIVPYMHFEIIPLSANKGVAK